MVKERLSGAGNRKEPVKALKDRAAADV